MTTQKTLFQMNNRCQITVENGMLVVATPYDPHLVSAIKLLPYTERRYDPNRKVWLVDPRHGQKVADWIEIYFGESVILPAITQYQERPVMRLLKVRYLGACKKREDGSSVAFGLVGNDWGILIPEEILRAFFDASECLNPDSTTTLLTLYQVLGIRKAASADDIKTAYRRMVKQWHPDVCKETNAQEMFIRIQEAYNLLGDPNKRARYDAGLALQAEYEKEAKKQEKFDSTQYQASYRSPLRCGMLMVEGIEKVGRLEVSKILAWEDIVVNGKTLVVSWPMGAKEPVEVWS